MKVHLLEITERDDDRLALAGELRTFDSLEAVSFELEPRAVNQRELAYIRHMVHFDYEIEPADEEGFYRLMTFHPRETWGYHPLALTLESLGQELVTRIRPIEEDEHISELTIVVRPRQTRFPKLSAEEMSELPDELEESAAAD